MSNTIRRALLSVSNKQGIVELASVLRSLNIEILSTGGTAELLKRHDISFTTVSDYTGSPEIMSGRVKTLHPKIHGGILARANIDEAVLEQHKIAAIDLVVVNLYPFAQTIADPDCSYPNAIEHIDIGGPAMIRAAAKNHERVTVVVDPQDYPQLIIQLQKNQSLKFSQRQSLASKAFAHTAKYDAAIANYLEQHTSINRVEFPEHYTCSYYKKQALRYGENPHLPAAFYIEANPPSGSIAIAKQLQGKELSYNNIADADAAYECVKEFNEPACVIVKHANPCGVAMCHSQLAAYQRAYSTDPQASFGGIIAFNQELQAATADAIINNQFVEVIIAPEVSAAAASILASKTNIRVLECGTSSNTPSPRLDYKKVHGGLLIQQYDSHKIDVSQLTAVTQRRPTAAELLDLQFAWQVVKHVKSNAIVYAKDQATIGIGAGQPSRVSSAIIAGIKANEAGLNISGSVMASDAFFPFRDGIDAAAAVNITAIIQPGGSIRDDEIIQAANEANIAMLFTGFRHFRH